MSAAIETHLSVARELKHKLDSGKGDDTLMVSLPFFFPARF